MYTSLIPRVVSVLALPSAALGVMAYLEGVTAMLVLSRKCDEKIVIGNSQIILTIIEVRRDRVRIGILAPEFGVVRSEVIEDGIRPGPPPPTDGTGLLVLSRKKDEKILIGDNVDIMVVDIQGDKVRLGINAPRDVTVHREEVFIAIQKKATEI